MIWINRQLQNFTKSTRLYFAVLTDAALTHITPGIQVHYVSAIILVVGRQPCTLYTDTSSNYASFQLGFIPYFNIS